MTWPATGDFKRTKDFSGDSIKKEELLSFARPLFASCNVFSRLIHRNALRFHAVSTSDSQGKQDVLMDSFLKYEKPFAWKKQGLIFEPSLPGFSHGSHPCAIHYKEDIFVFAFTMRDQKQRSQIFLSYARVCDGTVELLGQPKLALSHGCPGYFDCDGAISGCFIKHNDTIYLYYVGWQNLPEEMWICDTGRAVLDPRLLTLEREFAGPVLGRDKTNPLFAAATAFHIQDGVWHTWYNSGVSWEKTENGWHHRYGFHHAQSVDGVDWACDAEMCIPFADEYEYAFGRPSVYVQNGVYNMWFAHRATKLIPTYRIGFAHSLDGIHWNRNDSISGIDVSPTGWDSEMICYPCVFEHKDALYMLYNGNGYGKTGFGLAVLEEA